MRGKLSSGRELLAHHWTTKPKPCRKLLHGAYGSSGSRWWLGRCRCPRQAVRHCRSLCPHGQHHRRYTPCTSCSGSLELRCVLSPPPMIPRLHRIWHSTLAAVDQSPPSHLLYCPWAYGNRALPPLSMWIRGLPERSGAATRQSCGFTAARRYCQ